jgi:hypothetical protein
MKNWGWLLLIMVALMSGCAEGYSAKPQGYQEPAPALRETGTWRNPETDAERQTRIWREEAGR